VDVIDSECAGFEEYLAKATDFQDVLRQHRHMLMNVCRLSMVENTMVQDCFDRILHSCLRFVSLCRVNALDQDAAVAPLNLLSQVDVPATLATRSVVAAEIESIRTEFYSQLGFLFQVMRKLDNRGFLFRLDFNGFLSRHTMASWVKKYMKLHDMLHLVWCTSHALYCSQKLQFIFEKVSSNKNYQYSRSHRNDQTHTGGPGGILRASRKFSAVTLDIVSAS
jgi:hypothetical protein